MGKEKAQTQLGYCIQAGASGVGKHMAMSIASIVTTAGCLLLISALFMLALNIKVNMEQFQVENAMLAFVDDSFTQSRAKALQPELERVAGVAKVTFVSREEALDAYIEQYGETGTSNSHLEPAVFRDRYAIELKDQATAAEVSEAMLMIPGIADTRVDEVVSSGFSVIQQVVTMVGILLSVLLLTIAVVIMTNTIKLTTLARKEEIAVMKMMGAYDSFIRLPFIIEGCIVGSAGALIAFLLSTLVYASLGGIMSGSGILSIIEVQPYTALACKLFAVNLFLGLGVGVAGSAITIRKHLDT